MNILSIKYSKLCNYDIVYSKNISRPSKTLVDPNVYNLYNLVKLDPYSDLKDEILIECLNYFNDDFILDNNSDNYNCNEDYILVQNNNLYEIYNFISSCNLNINTIIHINDIYNYPKIQLIKLLSMIFSDVKISVSNYKNSGLICCTNKIYNINPCKNFNIKEARCEECSKKHICRFCKKNEVPQPWMSKCKCCWMSSMGLAVS